ncbi:hypothetical protein B9Z55_011539 [Caenorhabditis nigoni]|uniref:Uncharacterized protein n=1 Tax=Caenorhabditis nigoni TaxID=1611254 RepID=A0A2G5UKJ8_9PELO|nr:hypothetical protein B9Z55_011539 [Caenorhabditis nigoni]
MFFFSNFKYKDKKVYAPPKKVDDTDEKGGICAVQKRQKKNKKEKRIREKGEIQGEDRGLENEVKATEDDANCAQKTEKPRRSFVS